MEQLSIRLAMENAAAHLASLDVVEHADALAESDRERTRIGEAIESSHRRIAEINQTIQRDREQGPDPAAVADELLEHGSVALALVDREALQTEKQALMAGISDLNRREEEARARGMEHKSAAAGDFSACVLELADADEAQARALASELAALYASAVAISAATSSTRHDRLASALRDALANLARERVIDRHAIAVPTDVAKMLDAGRAAMTALGRAYPIQVSFPDTLPNAVIAMLGARLATANSRLAAAGLREA